MQKEITKELEQAIRFEMHARKVRAYHRKMIIEALWFVALVVVGSVLAYLLKIIIG